MEAEATPITLEDDWLKQLLGPETTAFATTATEVASVPAQTFVAAAVPVQKRRQKSGQAYVTPPALRKENAIKAGKGRATVIAVKVDPNELSDTEEAAPPAPPPLPHQWQARRRSDRERCAKLNSAPPPQHSQSPIPSIPIAPHRPFPRARGDLHHPHHRSTHPVAPLPTLLLVCLCNPSSRRRARPQPPATPPVASRLRSVPASRVARAAQPPPRVGAPAATTSSWTSRR